MTRFVARSAPTRRQLLAGAAGLAATLAAPSIRRAAAAAGEINLYTARHYDTDEALYTDFTKATGIKVNRIEANPDALIERMRSEGVNSPADVFVSVDAGRIERARELGLLRKVDSERLVAAIPAHLRDPDGHWFGFSKRARVILYNRDRVQPSQLSTYEDLADPKWKGKVLIRSSTNIYNQSLTGAVLAAHGPDRTEAWCRGLVANLARPPRGGDTDQIKACGAGEGDVAVANTYYFGAIVASRKPDDVALAARIGVFFPNQGDRGTHVNISGGGVAAQAKNPEGALRFLEHLAAASAQKYFAEGNNEYPVVAGVAPPATVAAWGAFREDTVNARVFARNNAQALQIMDRAGWK